MKYDEILTHLGDFGRFQKKVYFLVCLVAIPHAFQTLGILFTMGGQDHRCAIPDLPNDTFAVQDERHREAIEEWIPYDKEEEHLSSCLVFVRNATTHLFINKTQTCSRYVYDTGVFKSTITADENMVCDRKSLTTYSNMIYMAGMLTGSLVMGAMSDSIGRKTTLMIAIACHLVVSFSTFFVKSYFSFVVLRFLTAVFGMGLFMIAFVMGMEIVGPQTRKFAGIIIELFWVLGLFLNVFLAYFIREWRTLQIATAIPTVLLLSYAFLLPESPRWLIRKGRHKQALKVLQQAAKSNKVCLPDDAISMEAASEGDGDGQGGAKIWQMFTVRVLLIRTLVIIYNWFACSFVYFGLTLNVGALSGDIYVNMLLSSLVEGLAYLTCFVLLDRAGRKFLMVSCNIVAGVACLATMFPVMYGTKDHAWITQVLSLVGRYGSCCTFAVVYIYSAEVFPTTTRNSGIGICSFSARIGGILAPYIADLGNIVGGDLGTALPLIIFGGASLLAGILTIMLPETTNRVLPDSIQEAKEFGRNPPKKNCVHEGKNKENDLMCSYTLVKGGNNTSTGNGHADAMDNGNNNV